jgi:hypothetical protein
MIHSLEIIRPAKSYSDVYLIMQAQLNHSHREDITRRKSKFAIFLFLAGLLLAAMACSIAGINPAASPTPTPFVLPTPSGPTATADTIRAETYI